jgi:RNA polymerase sigma-70 factor (ECF subfamily)
LSVVENTAIGSLYQDHHTWLFSLLNRKLNNSADAADLAQDAFVNLLKKPKHFTANFAENCVDKSSDNSGARNYLSRVAAGLCVDLWRRQQVERAYLEVLALRPESVAINPEQQHCLLETLFEIDKLLSQLPDKVASVFIMGQLDGLSYQKIAIKQGISLRSVNNYMAIALVKLAKLMDAVAD